MLRASRAGAPAREASFGLAAGAASAAAELAPDQCVCAAYTNQCFLYSLHRRRVDA